MQPGPAESRRRDDQPGRSPQLEDELAIARAALDATAEGIVVVDTRSWRIRQINAPALVMLDLDSAEVPKIGFNAICRCMRAEDGTSPSAASLLGAVPFSAEYRYVPEHGEPVPVELRASGLRLAGRDLLVLALRDISERVRTASELSAASARCGVTFSQAAIGLAHVTLDGRWSNVNARLAAIVGYPEAELPGMPLDRMTHPDDLASDAVARQRLLDGELSYSTREKRYIRKDGVPVWVSVHNSLARDAHGVPLYFIAMVEDITERKRSEKRIRHLASHDALTGLPNRLGLQDHLDRTLQSARSTGLQVGVVFVDMDKLKQINDTLGHEEGDAALMKLAQELQRQVRGDDLVARIGGDEFVIVLSDIASRADIVTILDRILFTPASPSDRTGASYAAACSIGVSVFPQDGGDSRTLIRHADQAMYQAKQGGGARYAFYSEERRAGTPARPTLVTSTGKR
jgi:diguanylate cyclase (GGDEF)-like protein/PAS domain S-box-containing protein